MHAILGLLILLAAAGALARLARGVPGAAGDPLVVLVARPSPRRASPFRAGPWPGLTWRGAGVLVVCAWMLLGCELLVGIPRRAWPDLVLVGVLAVVPPLVATCVVRAPGCAAGVCGVYLLGRSLASLAEPTLALPPLLLPSALACDVAVWLRRPDLRRPTRQVWRRRSRSDRRLTTWRAALGGAAFGVVLTLVEPPYALLLGGEPSGWTATQQGLAGAVATLACTVAGAAIERITKGARPPA